MNVKSLIPIIAIGLFSCQTKKKILNENQVSKKVESFSQTTSIPEGITTHDDVETSIGKLKFIDGAPQPETAELI